MLFEELKNLVGKNISIEQNGANHPTSGVVERADGDCLVIRQHRGMVLVPTKYILTILYEVNSRDGEIQSQVYKPKLASPKGRAI